MWGLDAAASTVLTAEFFLKHSIKNVLIPGVGYGRNAKHFMDQGMKVTGIEISKTAIDLAQKHFGDDLKIHHGSVTEMHFDDVLYEGIYCYGLIYLLDKSERLKLIEDCYNQLTDGGYMVFTAITKNAETYGEGKEIGIDRYEMFGGVSIFFYDEKSIEEEFGNYGYFELSQVQENYPFYVIKCKK